jgi:hypothetical protein
MYLTSKDHYDYIQTLLEDQPSLVLISTFNVHAGILHDGRDVTEWGDKFHSRTHDILDLLSKQKRVHILVGVPGFYPPDPGCETCKEKRFNALYKYLAHAQHWPDIKWKMARDVHMKCFLSVHGGNMKGIAGGRNLTDSEALDVSFPLEKTQATALAKHFLDNWQKADPLIEETVEQYYEEDLIEQAEKLQKELDKQRFRPSH